MSEEASKDSFNETASIRSTQCSFFSKSQKGIGGSLNVVAAVLSKKAFDRVVKALLCLRNQTPLHSGKLQ